MPETTENFHWIPVRDAATFVQDSFRQITLKESQGIHARIGKLNSDPEGGTIIQAYYFDKDKWSMEEAQSWVKDHNQRRFSSLSASEPYTRRFYDHEMQIRVEGRTRTIVGYAAVFNKEAQIAPGFFEEVAPGAFTRAIVEDDVRCLFNHEQSLLLGRTKSGTLRLSEDSKGLHYEAIPPASPLVDYWLTLIARGDISQSSFGFNIGQQDRKVEDSGRRIRRIIRSVKLFDVSPVTFPAYSETEAHVRRIGGEKDCFWIDEHSEEIYGLRETVPAEAEVSKEELYQRIEDMKKKVLG